MPLLRNHISHDRGVALLELAMVLPIVMLCMGGVIDYGMILRENAVMAVSARVAARTAAGQLDSTGLYLCQLAKSTAAESLRAAGLNPALYNIGVESVLVDSDQAIRVTVTRPTRFYFLRTNSWSSAVQSSFLTESGIAPEENC